MFQACKTKTELLPLPEKIRRTPSGAGLVPLVPRDTGHQGAREPDETHSPSDSGFLSWVVSALTPALATPEGKAPCLDPPLQLQIPRFSAPMSP
ncbi:hypothetical protein E5288_WYG003653 [Bos mutus]|uniref:Uncharacterized protein n=1 Tax=Bos mutus TaxID=72004 RepID=A0A6B0RT75_9CETA|nr:hypothetical protein [Bos mutus]